MYRKGVENENPSKLFQNFVKYKRNDISVQFNLQNIYLVDYRGEFQHDLELFSLKFYKRGQNLIYDFILPSLYWFRLSVCFYPINVSTVKPIRSIFFCDNSHDPKVGIWLVKNWKVLPVKNVFLLQIYQCKQKKWEILFYEEKVPTWMIQI